LSISGCGLLSINKEGVFNVSEGGKRRVRGGHLASRHQTPGKKTKLLAVKK